MRVAEFFEPRRNDFPPIEHPRAVMGGNNPPGPLEMAENIMQALSDWMKDHPVIETEDDARAAKPLIDRAKAAMDELEAERDGKVRPYNEEVAKINAEYKAVHNTDAKKPGTFNKVFNELKARVADYLRKEEQKRLAAAAEARRLQEEAEQQAREAEARELAALSDAAVGGVGVDVAAVTKEADAAFETFERQSRFADRAERDTKVKIGGGFAASVGLRNSEVLQVDDALKAIIVMGTTDRIREAILTEARAYRKANGRLPDGISATTERKL
jgi:hypothetical protein